MELINILLGGGILAFIQWAVDKLSLWHTKNDKTVKALDGLSDKVEALKEFFREAGQAVDTTHLTDSVTMLTKEGFELRHEVFLHDAVAPEEMTEE